MNKNIQNNIFQEERLKLITIKLEEEDRVLITDLCKDFNTTPVTIRKDLDILEKEGILKRTHGGAIKNSSLFRGLALNEKEKLNIAEKERIVNKAAELISVGDKIILDSGSTTTLLARKIKNMSGITVITNALNIAQELSQSDIEVILTGGSLLRDTSTLVGPLAEEVLYKISADKLFQGVDGIDLDFGLTTPNIIEARTSREMMNVSRENILLADSSKFGRRSFGVICKIDALDKIITTKKLSAKESEKFNEAKVEVIVV